MHRFPSSINSFKFIGPPEDNLWSLHVLQNIPPSTVFLVVAVGKVKDISKEMFPISSSWHIMSAQ